MFEICFIHKVSDNNTNTIKADTPMELFYVVYMNRTHWEIQKVF